MKRLGRGALPLAGAGLSLALGLLDPAAAGLWPRVGYLILGAFLGGMIWVAWAWLRDEPPRQVALALAAGLALRLALALFMQQALPTVGYADSIPHQHGYIYKDAFNRDGDAAALAVSDKGLFSALLVPQTSDQYGGLLLLSAAIYRLLGGGQHLPWMVLLLTTTAGALAVPWSWAYARRAFGARPALVAAWFAALYPEAVLLSASQMREPFLMAAFALALAGQARLQQGRGGAGAVVLALGLCLFISPPYALILILLLAGAWLFGKAPAGAWRWALLGALVSVPALYFTVRAWAALQGGPQGGVLELFGWWIASGARYQLYLLTEQSGWVQKIFGLVPEWAQMPLATAYGLLQPFLPAALMDSTSVPFIRALVSWRAAGWFFSLPFIVYAPLAALRARQWRRPALYLSLVVWASAIMASYRDAGRLWDNPRWRAVFLVAQAALVGWAWVWARGQNSPWLRRLAVVVAFTTLAFMHWEGGRYYQWPRLNLWETMGLSLAFAALYLGGGALLDGWRRRRGRLGGARD